MVTGEREKVVSAEQLLDIIQIPKEFRRQGSSVVGPGTTMVIARPASTASTTTPAEHGITVVTGEK